MKEIIVEQGNEFKIKIREIQKTAGEKDIFENDIFANAYKQAALRVEEIVTATEALNEYGASVKRNEEVESKCDYLNNIIAFSGERGQGKSSAMLSFAHYLEKISDLRDYNIFKEYTCKYQYISLETIDPSTFEDMHNVLEVVVARMYNRFATKYKNDNTFVTKEQKNRIMELFQKVYESLCLIRNPKKLEDLENDYEGSIQKIAQIGDSTNLKKEISEMVRIYLDIFTQGNRRSFLIIPIDDLDINIKYAYRITEQIRKYLIIPNVIIIMAINIEQLKKCIEKEFRLQFFTLISKVHPLPDDETVSMAAQYVEKLIPDGRKIPLPEIRAISQGGNDAVEVIYQKRGSEINILQNENRKGIEESILGFIYDKTGIVFVKPANGIHNIIPNTLRELVNLLSVLGKMEDFRLESADKRVQLENILLFEDYFIHTWTTNHLDYGNNQTIRELLSENTFQKHRLICVSIMDKLEKGEMYTVERDSLKPTDENFMSMKRKISTKNSNHMSYSLGDVLDLLDVLSTTYINVQTDNLVFAIKTIYTIIMHKIVLSQEQDKTENDQSQPNNIYKFIGGSIWGYKLDATLRGGRSKFPYSRNKALEGLYSGNDYITNEAMDTELARRVTNLTLFSNYTESRNSDPVYLQKLISDNHSIKKTITFSIDNFFIAPLDLKYIYYKIGLDVLDFNYFEFEKHIENIRNGINIDLIQNIDINIELSEYIQQFLKDRNDIRSSTKEDESIYFKHFISNIENALKKICYLNLTQAMENSTIFNNETLLNELSYCFKLCSDANANKSSEKSDDKPEETQPASPQKKDTVQTILQEIKLSDQKNQLERAVQKASKNIDQVLASKPEKVNAIKIIGDICTAQYIRNKILNLAQNIAYYQSKKSAAFSDEVITTVRTIYIESSKIISAVGEGSKISPEIHEQYNRAVKEISHVIDEVNGR